MMAVTLTTTTMMLRSQCCHPCLSSASFNGKPPSPSPFLSLAKEPFFDGRRPRAGPFRLALAASRDPRPSKDPDLELLLHNKPSHIPVPTDDKDARSPSDSDDALAPFLKFFKSRDSAEEEHTSSGEENDAEAARGTKAEGEGEETVAVQYYEPKPGDLVVGVVVSGNENRLDVNVGADMLGTMLTKEVLPLYEAELSYLLCDRDKDAAEFAMPGKMGVLKDVEALSGRKVPGRPVVEVGTILFAEVLGRTLSGRPLLSTRRMFRRVAWHRVRQVLYAYSYWNL